MSNESKVIVCSPAELRELIEKATQPLQDELKELRRITNLRTYTLKQAEETTGINWQKLRRAHLAGKLQMTKEGRDYIIRHTDLQTYIEQYGEVE